MASPETRKRRDQTKIVITKIVITIESKNLIRGDNRGHQKAERPRPLAACSTGVGIRNVPATHDFKHDYYSGRLRAHVLYIWACM